MKYRQLRVVATGQWLDVMFTVQAKNGNPDVFSVPELSHRTDIAAAFGLPSSALEVVDADSDVRIGPLLPLPIPPAPPPDPDLVTFDAGTPAQKLDVLRRRVFRL